MTANKKAVESQFLRSAEIGDLETLKACLAANVDVDLQDKDGWTALIYAAWHENQKIASTLLAHGASVNLQNKYGWTALTWAASNDYQQIISILLAHGASVDLQDKDGNTALMQAAGNGPP